MAAHVTEQIERESRSKQSDVKSMTAAQPGSRC